MNISFLKPQIPIHKMHFIQLAFSENGYYEYCTFHSCASLRFSRSLMIPTSMIHFLQGAILKSSFASFDTIFILLPELQSPVSEFSVVLTVQVWGSHEEWLVAL